MSGDRTTDAEGLPLPFAHGHSFATLDAYLAHLRDYAGPVGQPGIARFAPASTSTSPP
ncbi:MAG TPA: hypothetical protein VLK25_07200 [Allosphingosinicella sp.]|nr:hypothetical protein [Allosphingosinicella sp.]